MRLKTLENQMRVFMNPHDYNVMLDSADSRRGRLAMRIMGEASCRVEEPPKPLWGDLRKSTHPDVDLWFLPIYGKDTRDRDTDGKRRDVWINDDLKEAIDEYCKIEGRSKNQHIFMCSKRTLQKEVERARDNAVVRTGNSDYGHISSHDFRAYFATNLCLREGVNDDIVMELGGWDDESTFRGAYLNAQFDDIIQMHLAQAGVIEVEGDVALTEYQRLQQEIHELKQAIDDLDLNININGGSQATGADSSAGKLSDYAEDNG